MKITKTALSILAIAISSSAFAATSSDTDSEKSSADAYQGIFGIHRPDSGKAEAIKNQIEFVVHTSDLKDSTDNVSYDAVNVAAAAQIFSGARGDIQLKSLLLCQMVRSLRN
ncbi:hypothetical protein [Pseudomonas sp. HY13-MNA-CIBAN-0226]|uniref:hypothetical protein n=1 Tax=Pseudomonas sp. HY13-MNA-CIBAN-0226 TaxID=3140473 RepID=UPI003323F51D